MALRERNPRVLAIDAGGTMTDTFVVDASGQFVVGKAQTTPEDESIGFIRSAEDALTYWGLEPGIASSATRADGIARSIQREKYTMVDVSAPPY